MPESSAGVMTRHDLGITPFWSEATPAERARQEAWHRELAGRCQRLTFGDEVFVSPLSAVFADVLVLGDRTYLSGNTCLWGTITLGADCTLNPYSELRGKVTTGDGVRIGAHVSILGFNHEMEPELPVHQQGLTSIGITIGDDVWIGSHAVVVDGVSIGSHSVIGAGAVVTRPVPEWAVVAGNPARQIGDRRHRRNRRRQDPVVDQAVRLADAAREELPQILTRAWERGEGVTFTDSPAMGPTVRAWCDAVELVSALDVPEALPVTATEVMSTMQSWQRADSGLIPRWGEDEAQWSDDGHDEVLYHTLSVGHALRLLGGSLEHPVVAARCAADELEESLEQLPWKESAWPAGSWVDAMATAMSWNRELFDERPALTTLVGWLTTRNDPALGLWGAPGADGDLVQPVNGTYRAVRGAFAHFGVPLPHPRATIDAVLTHAADRRHFTPERGTACNTLDVIHLLWYAGRQTDHRRGEGEEWARHQVERLCRSWEPGRGFSFTLQQGARWDQAAGLLGTEMWLSILWLLSDHLGFSDRLGLRPRGIHRPEPAARFEVAR